MLETVVSVIQCLVSFISCRTSVVHQNTIYHDNDDNNTVTQYLCKLLTISDHLDKHIHPHTHTHHTHRHTPYTHTTHTHHTHTTHTHTHTHTHHTHTTHTHTHTHTHLIQIYLHSKTQFTTLFNFCFFFAFICSSPVKHSLMKYKTWKL